MGLLRLIFVTLGCIIFFQFSSYAASDDIPIEGDTLICVSSAISTYTIDADGYDFEWSIRGNDSLVYTALNNSFLINWNIPGAHTLVVKYYDTTDVMQKSELLVMVLETPNAAFSYDYYQDYVDFSNNTEEQYIEEEDIWIQNKYYWNFGRNNDSLIEVEWDTVIQYNHGIYEVKLIVESPAGCIDSMQRAIEFGDFAGIYVPDAFCPTSASERVRTFKAFGQNLLEFRMWIFDTWGNLIWFSDKLVDGVPCEGWDGYYGGTLMRGGVYIWKIEATLRNHTPWNGIEHNGELIKMGNLMMIQ